MLSMMQNVRMCLRQFTKHKGILRSFANKTNIFNVRSNLELNFVQATAIYLNEQLSSTDFTLQIPPSSLPPLLNSPAHFILILPPSFLSKSNNYKKQCWKQTFPVDFLDAKIESYMWAKIKTPLKVITVIIGGRVLFQKLAYLCMFVCAGKLFSSPELFTPKVNHSKREVGENQGCTQSSKVWSV